MYLAQKYRITKYSAHSAEYTVQSVEDRGQRAEAYLLYGWWGLSVQYLARAHGQLLQVRIFHTCINTVYSVTNFRTVLKCKSQVLTFTSYNKQE